MLEKIYRKQWNDVATNKNCHLKPVFGVKNKKEEAKRLIVDNKIYILCVPETEIKVCYPVELLTFRG